MSNFPKITTERLQLDQLQSSDISSIVSYASSKKIAAYTLNIPNPYNEKAAIYWINLANQGFTNGTHLIVAMRLTKSLEFIGGMGLTIQKQFNRAELGFWIAEPFWNNGYATEGAKSMINYGFNNLGLNKITSSHFLENPASGRVLEKSGLLKEGVLKAHVCKGSRYFDLVVFGLTKNEYNQRNSK